MATIREQLHKLPRKPGVYQFYDRRGALLYIGKASDLRSRVQSYFRPSTPLSPPKEILVHDIQDIQWIETQSEIEALLLEASLIKKHQPRFNVLMRDDKSYVYIKVSTEEEWPRVFATRRLDKSGTYFGPFTSSTAVYETMKAIRKIIPYRCPAKPDQASPGSQRIATSNLQLAASSKKPAARSQPLRACLWYHLGRCPGTCVGAISKTEYRKSIRRIILFLSGKMDVLRRALKREMGSERVELLENVLAHTQILATSERYVFDAHALARALHLSKAPHRIEGYDISNTSGREATGAMVVFTDGEPEKREYKKFKIKTVRGADDARMIEEVLTRRLRHSDATKSDFAREVGLQWPLPDLIIIDGGKAQLNAAVRVIKKAGRAIPIISIAKGGHGGVLKQKEEIYFPGERSPLKLPNSSAALHLILRVRDEAHRFAIGYHKVLRRKKFFNLYRSDR